MIDVLVIGAGPAGLAAATVLAKRCSVIVVDRDTEPGGVPRHCHHTGFGWLDLKRISSGPAYAKRRVDLALAAGVGIHTETSVLGWGAGAVVTTTSPTSPAKLAARAILLATGCRERPRAARLVAGDRPSGVLTTGSLQQLVHGLGARPGNRAVVVGAEHVSYSAVQTLREAGCEVVAMTTPYREHQSYAPFAWWTTRMRVPLLAETEVVAIRGRARVEAVMLRGPAGTSELACDTVVFTGDWIPDHELARLGGIEIDPGTRGPAVDAALRTSRPNVFAAGNLLHGAEMADVAALEGIAAAKSILDHLSTVVAWPHERVPITVESPLSWIAPNRLTGGGAPPRGRFVFRVETFLRDAHVVVEQGGHVLVEQRFSRLVPNRWYHLDAAWAARVDLAGAPIRVGVLGD
jgi:NADPH-dependent 2,4-dienoyl-CoA reductase/sulfur reductase-like enzyme